MKKLWKGLGVLSILILAAFSVMACGGDGTAVTGAKGFVAIDINPSVEIITDSNGKVTSVRAANADAQTLLIDLHLTGKTLSEATEIIVSNAEKMGFINETNKKVSILAEGETEKDTKALEEAANEGAAKGSDQATVNVNSSKSLTRDIEELKKQNPELYKNMSVAKLRLIYSVMEYDNTFTVEKGASMKVSDLSDYLEDMQEEFEDMVSDDLEKEYKNKYNEKLIAIERKIEAVYGEEYAAKAELVRTLDQKEDAYEDALENRELSEEDVTAIVTALNVDRAELANADGIVTVLSAEKFLDKLEDEFDDVNEDEEEAFEEKLDKLEEILEKYEDDENLTAEMIAEIKTLTNADVTTLDELEELAEQYEDELEVLKDSITLTDEQKAQIKTLNEEKKGVKAEVKAEMKAAIDEMKKQLKADKDNKLNKK